MLKGKLIPDAVMYFLGVAEDSEYDDDDDEAYEEGDEEEEGEEGGEVAEGQKQECKQQ